MMSRDFLPGSAQSFDQPYTMNSARLADKARDIAARI